MRTPLLATSIVAVACAQPPVQEVEMAAGRVERAREAGAALYAPELMEEAEAALVRSREALAEREKYRTAMSQAALACLRADEARAAALRERQRVARETDRLLREAEALIEQARSRGGERGDPAALHEYALRWTELRGKLEQGRAVEALPGARALKSELLGFLHRLTAAGRDRPG